MRVKSYEQFLNEDLGGSYNYYGPGALFPLVSKLKQEGKSEKQIYDYLTHIGVDEDRKREVISEFFVIINQKM